jgi:hypothetical protein
MLPPPSGTRVTHVDFGHAQPSHQTYRNIFGRTGRTPDYEP